MFSQNQEEKHILEYFNRRSSLASPTPPMWVVEGRKPAFCDIGANDGVTFSNTRALALTGEWVGVLVEPSPKAFERLKKLYNGNKGFYVYPFALSDHNGKGMLQESSALCSAADIGLVSTFNNNEMERFKRTVSYEPVEVKTFKWKTFLNRLTIKEFDFISIDIESDEMKVLPDIDLSRVSCVAIEWNSKPELKKEYDYYLRDFHVIYTSGENLIYVR